MDIVTRTEILLGRLNRISSDQTLGYILESEDSSPNDADEAFEFVKEAPEVMRELLDEVKRLRRQTSFDVESAVRILSEAAGDFFKNLPSISLLDYRKFEDE